MEWPWWITLLSLLAGPITALIALYFNDRRSKRNIDQTVTISKQEAETNEFSVLTAGYTASFERLTKEVGAERERGDKMEADVARQKTLNNAITDELAIVKAANRRLADRVDIILDHLGRVEQMVPNPPGPPPRPILESMDSRPRRDW